jgi:dTDP-4-amino-4,6-dideoxygalactose transaminase
MINWVPKKVVDTDDIKRKIDCCIESKHFTNNGKNVIDLQKNIKNYFKLDKNKEILLTCNGSMGINALIGGLNIFYKKKLTFVVQSFTFPCSKQGLLFDSIILDIDENMGPSISELNKRINDYDGIFVTNCFGCSSNIEIYEKFCKDNNKILLFDNAASPLTFYKNKNILNYGLGCMVSLHHTKPIGFGEGGFIVFDKIYLESMEKTICFGFTKYDRYNYESYAGNYKMSEISSIYISNYLKNLNDIYLHHIKIICYFIKKINETEIKEKIHLFTNFSSFENSLTSTIPILFDNDVQVDFFIENNIEAKKYYYPLDLNCYNSNKLFRSIICLPLNTDITFETIDYYIDVLNKFVFSKE